MRRTNCWYQSLPLQILAAVACGILLGILFPEGRLKALSEGGRIIIHWVKLIAGPFLFLTIVASIVEVRLRASHGVRLVAIALFNTAVAIAIGIALAALFLRGFTIDGVDLKTPSAPVAALEMSSWVKTMMPSSLFAPFVNNDILLIALLALLTGLAIRRSYPQASLGAVARKFENVREVPGVMLTWLIRIIPLAVLAVVAGSVSEHGVGIFLSLGGYVAVVIAGFALQVVIVYAFWIFGVARIKPSRFFKIAREPVTYAFGVNSSLATLPLTLKALRDLGVSDRSASLGAGVATNLNNDGIVLYEAMAVFFIAQLHHIDLSAGQMVTASLACIVASAGITGIPEAGFISLSMVVATLGLPAETLPLLLAVDWMIARLRSVVNVLSDMTLSIAMDATEGAEK